MPSLTLATEAQRRCELAAEAIRRVVVFVEVRRRTDHGIGSSKVRRLITRFDNQVAVAPVECRRVGHRRTLGVRETPEGRLIHDEAGVLSMLVEPEELPGAFRRFASRFHANIQRLGGRRFVFRDLCDRIDQIANSVATQIECEDRGEITARIALDPNLRRAARDVPRTRSRTPFMTSPSSSLPEPALRRATSGVERASARGPFGVRLRKIGTLPPTPAAPIRWGTAEAPSPTAARVRTPPPRKLSQDPLHARERRAGLRNDRFFRTAIDHRLLQRDQLLDLPRVRRISVNCLILRALGVAETVVRVVVDRPRDGGW